MSIFRRLGGLIVAIFVSVSAFAETPTPVKLPDRAEGNVNGLQGITFWPIDEQERPMDPAGCTVYLVPSDDVNERLSYPCGKWIAPPRGRYTRWLEQGTRISQQAVVMNGSATFQGNGTIALVPLKAAGFAAIAPEVSIGKDETVRYLSLEPSMRGWEKRLQRDEAKSVVRLPAGRAVAGIFNSDVRSSRPAHQKDGQI